MYVPFDDRIKTPSLSSVNLSLWAIYTIAMLNNPTSFRFCETRSSSAVFFSVCLLGITWTGTTTKKRGTNGEISGFSWEKHRKSQWEVRKWVVIAEATRKVLDFMCFLPFAESKSSFQRRAHKKVQGSTCKRSVWFHGWFSKSRFHALNLVGSWENSASCYQLEWYFQDKKTSLESFHL